MIRFNFICHLFLSNFWLNWRFLFFVFFTLWTEVIISGKLRQGKDLSFRLWLSLSAEETPEQFHHNLKVHLRTAKKQSRRLYFFANSSHESKTESNLDFRAFSGQIWIITINFFKINGTATFGSNIWSHCSNPTPSTAKCIKVLLFKISLIAH